MPLCVTGMHRSGTSMVMSLLAQLGLDLGDRQDLIPANPSNPDGHWENIHFVDLDDAVLDAYGGGWDLPPDAQTTAGEPEEIASLKARARQLHHDLGLKDPWGWKDPRVSVIFPFWRDVYGDLRVLICLRNPLDVAASLRRRAYSSSALGISLWKTYNERILSESSPDQRLVTHYATYFERPEAELERIAAFANLSPDAARMSAAVARIKARSRHHASGMADLRAAGVDREVIDLYRRLCDEARSCEAAEHRAERPHRTRARPVDGLLLELADARRRISALETSIDDRDRIIAEARGTITALEASIEELRRADAAARQQEAERQQQDIERRLQALQQAADRQAGEIDYQRAVRHIRRVVDQSVPEGATVAVVSNGDPDLIDLPRRCGVHFPQNGSGTYLGYHPKNSADAIAQLEAVHAQGADFLVIPAWSLWWLTKYDRFGEHLQRTPLVADDNAACHIFALSKNSRKGGGDKF